jgi:hypothetical protein
MKHRKINIFTAIALGAVIAFTACSKDDGAIPKRIGIEDVPAVSMNTHTGGIVDSIKFFNQAAFLGKFKASLFFTGAIPPSKIDIVVRKNGSAANVKLFKADLATLPAEFTVTAAEIKALFGDTLKLADNYDFGPNLYVGDKKYEAFPASSLGSGSGISGMSGIGFGEYVRVTVKP